MSIKYPILNNDELSKSVHMLKQDNLTNDKIVGKVKSDFEYTRIFFEIKLKNFLFISIIVNLVLLLLFGLCILKLSHQ
jgi:hypothetical protein